MAPDDIETQKQNASHATDRPTFGCCSIPVARFATDHLARVHGDSGFTDRAEHRVDRRSWERRTEIGNGGDISIRPARRYDRVVAPLQTDAYTTNSTTILLIKCHLRGGGRDEVIETNR